MADTILVFGELIWIKNIMIKALDIVGPPIPKH